MLCCGIKLKKSDKKSKPKDAATAEDAANKENAGSTAETPAVEAAAAAAEDETIEPFVQEMLDAHNRYRAHHQTAGLVHSAELTRGAQKWAEEIASRDRLDHDPESQRSMTGENVAMKYSSAHTNFPGTSFVDSWYSEAADYKFTGQEDQIECGHFTQVVWKASREAGFGRAISKSNKVYVVGRYKPAGNFIGEFTRNVMPPMDGKVLQPPPDPTKISATSGPKVEPVIGPDNPTDQLIETQTVTKTVGTKKVVNITETYRMPSGQTYTKTKETTTLGS